MKKVIFTLSILLLALCQMVMSQEMDCYQSTKYYLGKDNMSFFKEAELVVEGRFLKPQHAYAVKDADGKEHYYGICPVIAYRVFKGDAKAGDTIYVTREGMSLGDAIASPYPIWEDSVLHDVLWEYPRIAETKNIPVIDHFQNDCIMFFKNSCYPSTQDIRFL